MNSKKAKEILHAIVDNEASALEREEFEEYIKGDAELRAVYELEVRFRDSIRGKASEDCFPESAMLELTAKLDAIDAEPQGAENLSPEYQPLRVSTPTTPVQKPVTIRYALAMAASFVLMLVGGYATVSFFGHQAAFGAFENAHYVSRDNINNRNSMTNTADATSFINDKFGVNLDETIPGLELCGGEVVRLDNSDFAHFVFCDSTDSPVSIFVGAADGANFPDMPVTINAGKQYFNHTCHGCELMYWISGDAIIVAATTPHHMEDYPVSELVRYANIESSQTDSEVTDSE